MVVIRIARLVRSTNDTLRIVGRILKCLLNRAEIAAKGRIFTFFSISTAGVKTATVRSCNDVQKSGRAPPRLNIQD